MYLSAIALETRPIHDDDMKNILTHIVLDIASEWMQAGEPAHPMLLAFLCSCKHYMLCSDIFKQVNRPLVDFMNDIAQAENSSLDIDVTCACGSVSHKVRTVLRPNS